MQVSGKLIDKEQTLEEEIQLRERIDLQRKQAERMVDDLKIELDTAHQGKEELAKQIKQAQVRLSVPPAGVKRPCRKHHVPPSGGSSHVESWDAPQNRAGANQENTCTPKCSKPAGGALSRTAQRTFHNIHHPLECVTF